MTANKRLETIGSAAAGIAHDLNNQLMLILNYLSISDLESARTATDRCCDLTNSLLTYSRGRVSKSQPIDPLPFIRNFLAELRLPPGIQIALNSPENLPEIDADPLALERVLTNLISNAAAAMNHAGILRIVLREGSVSVEDNGPGISALNLTRVFEPFFTTKGHGGTGLGLAIVRQIMLEHGGSVSVDSKPGQGTSFRLQFRLTK